MSAVPTVAPSYIRNVLFNNNDSIDVSVAFSMYASNGPVAISAFTISNSRVENVRNHPVDMISTDFTTWGGCGNGFCFSDSGSVKNIRFDNVTFDTTGNTNSQLSGRSPTQNIDTIYFNAVHLAGPLVTDASTGHITLGSYVSNVIFTNVALDKVSPAAPSNLQIH